MASNELSKQASQLVTRMTSIEYLVSDDQIAAALSTIRKFTEEFSELVADLAQHAYNQGFTKKRIALLLDIPPGNLRGMEKTES